MTTTGDENVDFKSIINLALSNKIPWIPLRTLLHELTPTFEASRQLNDVLLEELQLLHSKQTEKVELSNENEVNQLDDFDIDQNSENDYAIQNKSDFEISESSPPLESNIDQEEENYSLINEKSIDLDELIPQFQNDVLETENLESDDFMIVRNEPEDDTPSHAFNEEDKIIKDEIAGSMKENISYSKHTEETELEMKAPDEYHDLTDEITVSRNGPEKEKKSNDSISDAIHNLQTEIAISSTREVEKKEWQDTTVFINGKRRFSCKTCGQLFTQIGNLKIHVRFHTGEKPYGCKFFNKRFADTGSLKLHERIHTGELPYECETCCKRFKAKSELTQHLRNHSEEKTFECVHCKKFFRHLSSLRYHIEKYHVQKSKVEKLIIPGKRKYSCLTCGQLFLQQEHLVKHNRIHTGEKQETTVENGSEEDVMAIITKQETISIDDLSFDTKKAREENVYNGSKGNPPEIEENEIEQLNEANVKFNDNFPSENSKVKIHEFCSNFYFGFFLSDMKTKSM